MASMAQRDLATEMHETAEALRLITAEIALMPAWKKQSPSGQDRLELSD